MDEEEIKKEFNKGTLCKKDSSGKVEKEYLKGEAFGKGGFATCFKVYSKEEKKIYLTKEVDYNDTIEKEARIHQSLENKNIVKLSEHFLNEQDGKYYLIMEFCENRDLSKLLNYRKKLTEIEVKYYIEHLINALKYLHEKRNIVHCDLKPSNIFLTDKLEVKLGDFGLAKKITKDFIPSINGGTIYYMPPEALESKNKISYKVDIWAVGIIIYNLLTGKLPFYSTDRDETEKKIKECKLDFPSDIKISNMSKDLIEQILKKDPNKRPTLNQILQHDFFTMGRKIPKLLLKSFIKKEPSIDYIRNFFVDVDKDGIIKKEPTQGKLINIELEEDKILKNNNINKQDNKNIYVKELFMSKNYINKYGLAYILSNDFYGVCFRDSTKIVYSPKTNNYLYVKDGEKKIFNPNNLNDINRTNSERENRDIKKKMKLLEYYMESKSKKSSSNDAYEKEQSKNNNNNRNYNDDDISEEQVYVKKYYIYENSPIALKLSNKIMEVYFNNNEIMLLDKEKNEATFIKKDKSELKSNVFQYNNAMETQNVEILKKLQVTKTLLGKIINDDNFL